MKLKNGISPKDRKENSRHKLKSAKTKEIFLDAAEGVFATHGYEGATIRAISEEANVQLGALHYYWGSKEAMFFAVLERRLRPQSEERLKRLEEIVIQAKGNPSIRQVLLAYYEPLLKMAQSDKTGLFTRLVLRALTDPSAEVRAALSRVGDEAVLRFIRVLRRACNHLDDQTFYARLPMVMGGMMFAVCNRMPIELHVPMEGAMPDLNTATHECIEALTLMLASQRLVEKQKKNRGL